MNGDIRIFKCQQCKFEKAIDTVFNFEVCPRCGGNFFPIDYVPPIDWKLRAEQAESELAKINGGEYSKREQDMLDRQKQLEQVIAKLTKRLEDAGISPYDS